MLTSSYYVSNKGSASVHPPFRGSTAYILSECESDLTISDCLESISAHLAALALLEGALALIIVWLWLSLA